MESIADIKQFTKGELDGLLGDLAPDGKKALARAVLTPYTLHRMLPRCTSHFILLYAKREREGRELSL